MVDMKAVEYIDRKIRLKEVPLPNFQEDEVLLEVKSCLLEKESEGKERIGGACFAGIVKACGEKVSIVGKGDRVAVDGAVACGKCHACRKGEISNCEHVSYYGKHNDGGYAQVVAVKETTLYKLSDETTFDEAIFARRVANLFAAFSKISNKSGYSMLIVGSGGNAEIARQMSKKTSAGKVTVMEEDVPFEKIKEEVGGVDIVVDLTGKNELTYQLLDLVIPGGSLLMLGKSKGKRTLDFSDARDFFFHIANIIPSNPRAGYFVEGLSYIEEKKINVSGLISGEIAYSQLEAETCVDEGIWVLHPND